MRHASASTSISAKKDAGALDAVLCIAVLHHISTLERRLAMLAELARVLRLGGRALVTVWASEQEQPGKLAKWEPIGEGESFAASGRHHAVSNCESAEQLDPTSLGWQDGQHFAQALTAHLGLSFLRRRRATSGCVYIASPTGWCILVLCLYILYRCRLFNVNQLNCSLC